MPDYSKGVIYMLEPTVEYEAGDVYYGSTLNPLYKRLFQHKNKGNNTSSKHLFEKYSNNIKIVLVKTFPCNSKQELFAEEGKYIRENKCVNKYIAGRSQAEYQQDHKEKIKAYITEYYQEHKEDLKTYKTEYYQKHKEEIKQTNKEYHQEHKAELNQKIKCECGCTVTKYKLTRHKRSKKHTQLLADVVTSQ